MLFRSNEFLPRTLLNSEGDETFVGLTGSVSVNKLDNRRLPRTGYSGRFTNTFYGRAFGSDSNLWKSELTFDRYFHLGDDPLSAAPGVYLGVVGGVARVGIWFLMITFGAAFGFTVMGRIALLAARFEFLFDDWLWLIDPTNQRTLADAAAVLGL